MIVAASRTVFVSGFFNILHPGHLRLLRFASELGERLVVGVLPDGRASDVVTVGQGSRFEEIQSLRMVDDASISEG